MRCLTLEYGAPGSPLKQGISHVHQLLLKNISQLVTVGTGGDRVKAGGAQRELGVMENASVLIENGVFRWIGTQGDAPPGLKEDITVIDASGKIALPGFVDSHTHLVFAGSREYEFAMRAGGKTYQQIAEQGGGILSTVHATRQATKRDLKRLAQGRLDAMLQQGTTTVEIKSGYGLDPDSEVKMLECIHELSEEQYSTVVATFLGAHAFPPEFRDSRDSYVDLVCDRMLPYVAKRRLAQFCDVFCESGYFSVDQSRRILLRAHELGIKLKVHADELAASGGSVLAAELRAASADHLEHIDSDGIALLKNAGTVATLLPGVSFFLNHGYAPARKLIDAGVPVALASDFNPGSCMSFSMPLMMTIACTHMGMTPEEAISASTINGAAALDLSDNYGSIEIGKKADIVLYDVPNYRYLIYHFGTNHVSLIIKHGVILEF
ncbi:MAG: imidazolonepropionase [Ignavibacteriales bacterium]|nr:imidazolonepropionase [Ignavibacteriales bacterium]